MGGGGSGGERDGGAPGLRLDRRGFLAAIPGAALAATSLRASDAGDDGGGTGARGRLEGIGAQIYTVRSEMQADERGTLESLAAIGYTEVELFGPWSRGGRELRKTLDDLGLRAVSSHIGMEEVRGDWDGMLDAALELGQSLIVIPSLPRESETPDGMRRIAGQLDRAGEMARARRLRLGFHNHDAVMHPWPDGSRPIDVLLEGTDPTLLDWQMDIYWTVHGGADPLAELERYRGRITSAHVKDRTAGGDMVDVGEGVIDFRTILQRAEAQGLRHAFVEHDWPEDPIESLRASYRHLRAMGY